MTAYHHEFNMILGALFQSFFSSILSLFFGLLISFSIFDFERRYQRPARTLKFLCFIPNFIAVIIVVFSLLDWNRHLFGFWSIVLAHTLINSGLAGTQIYSLLKTKVGRQAELAWVEASSFLLFWSVLIKALYLDFIRIGLFIFIICLSSFAIPLLLGGTHAPSIEVLIYEKLRLDSNWTHAICLSLFLFLVITFAIWFKFSFLKSQTDFELRYKQQNDIVNSPLLSSKVGYVFVYLPIVIILYPLLRENIKYLVNTNLSYEKYLSPHFLELLIGSLILAFGTGLLSLILLVCYYAIRPSAILRSFVLSWVTPSIVFSAFAILKVWPSFGWPTYLKIIFLNVFVHFSFLNRLGWDSLIDQLRPQYEISRSLGAHSLLILDQIELYQILPIAYKLAGFSALWAFADFSFAELLSDKEISLSQYAYHLLESYRWDEAYLIQFLILLGSIFCYIIFQGAAHVARRTP